jgi:hypothetical protein
MNRSSFSALLAVALVFILSSITASAQQPRAVPPNDSFTSPTAIQIGKKYSVSDIAGATNEINEPVASCRIGMSVIPHSVWFAVNLPENSRVYLSTFGTLLVTPNYHSINTVLAIYEQTDPGVFAERACSDDTNGLSAAVTFTATAGVTYYIVAGSYSDDSMLPESTLKLTTRMITTNILLPNHSFETPVNGTDWTLKNGGDDQPICSDASYPVISGSCAFRFTGTPDMMTKLSQTLPFPPAFAPRKNAFLTSFFYFRVMDTAALGTAKIKFIINYSDGTPPSIRTINLTGLAAMPVYDFRQFTHTLKSSKVASIKFVIKFGSPTGTLLVDYVRFRYDADAMTRAGGLLPVPQAPAAN